MTHASGTLPSAGGRLFLTDGGIETSLIHDDGFDLPHFAAFQLLANSIGRTGLVRYYERYVPIAQTARMGFILESPTWRANPDWGQRLGYSTLELAKANEAAIHLLRGLRDRHEAAETPLVVSGCVGPRGDGYVAGELLSPESAESYHDEQIAVLAQSGCDVLTAMTMTNVPEAIGIARAARRRQVPCVISFTVETDGRLPSGATVEHAIAEVDAATDSAPAYYMVNCAHPSHFADALRHRKTQIRRIRGVRANASRKSHRELNESVELDRGDPQELADEYGALAEHLSTLCVFGGCCGTDHHHASAIANRLTDRGGN